MEKKIDIKQGLNKIEEIIKWFDDQKEVDVEEGLKKLKQATPVLKCLKSKLQQIENEFKEIKKELKDI